MSATRSLPTVAMVGREADSDLSLTDHRGDPPSQREAHAISYRYTRIRDRVSVAALEASQRGGR